jgi:hypothetical protein
VVYGAFQGSRQVLARKVLEFKCIRCAPLTFLGTNLGSWRILSTPLAFSFSKKKKKKKNRERLLVWSYGAIQVSRQVLARKVLGFKCVRCDPSHFSRNEPGLLENSIYPTFIFFFKKKKKKKKKKKLGSFLLWDICML